MSSISLPYQAYVTLLEHRLDSQPVQRCRLTPYPTSSSTRFLKEYSQQTSRITAVRVTGSGTLQHLSCKSIGNSDKSTPRSPSTMSTPPNCSMRCVLGLGWRFTLGNSRSSRTGNGGPLKTLEVEHQLRKWRS